MKAKLLPTTGIGSLPHTDIYEAVSFSKKFDIPFLPELTALENSTKTKSIRDFKCFPHFMNEVKDEQIFKTQSFNGHENISNHQIHFIDDPLKLFKNSKDPVALHCCNRIDLSELEGLNISHLSFDANLIQDPKSFLYYLIKKEITPVIGVIRTDGGDITFCDNIDKWKPLLRKFVTKCWISPACGLSNFSTEQAEKALEMLQTLQREIIYSHL